jgi:hypothetical protein
MNSTLAFILEDFQERLALSDGQLMALAREVSHNGALYSFAQLTKRDCEELIFELEQIEAGRDLQSKLISHELALIG